MKFVLYNDLLIIIDIFNQLNLSGTITLPTTLSAGTNSRKVGLQMKMKLDNFAGDIDEGVEAWLNDTKLRFIYSKLN